MFALYFFMPHVFVWQSNTVKQLLRLHMSISPLSRVVFMGGLWIQSPSNRCITFIKPKMYQNTTKFNAKPPKM